MIGGFGNHPADRHLPSDLVLGPGGDLLLLPGSHWGHRLGLTTTAVALLLGAGAALAAMGFSEASGPSAGHGSAMLSLLRCHRRLTRLTLYTGSVHYRLRLLRRPVLAVASVEAGLGGSLLGRHLCCGLAHLVTRARSQRTKTARTVCSRGCVNSAATAS
jgi:hypothetical protein